MDEHIRHRAVERLEGEPSQVARASADATEGHLGHSLRREACDETVSMLRTVGPRKDREEVEVLRGSFTGLCGYCRLPSCICDSRRLSSCLAAPMGATPRVGQQVDLGARVVVPKSHERSHEFREGARHGENTSDPPEEHAVEGLYQRRAQDDRGQNSDVLDLEVGAQRLPPGAPRRSRTSAVVASANSISITRFRGRSTSGRRSGARELCSPRRSPPRPCSGCTRGPSAGHARENVVAALAVGEDRILWMKQAGFGVAGASGLLPSMFLSLLPVWLPSPGADQSHAAPLLLGPEPCDSAPVPAELPASSRSSGRQSRLPPPSYDRTARRAVFPQLAELLLRRRSWSIAWRSGWNAAQPPVKPQSPRQPIYLSVKRLG